MTEALNRENARKFRASQQAIPPLAAWLDANGRKGNGEGLDDFAQLLQQIISLDDQSDRDLAVLLRAMKTMMIATIEQGRIEDEKGTPIEAFLPSAARAMGYSVMAALCSVQVHDKVPPRAMARLFAEEFRAGALVMLDSFEPAAKDA